MKVRSLLFTVCLASSLARPLLAQEPVAEHTVSAPDAGPDKGVASAPDAGLDEDEGSRGHTLEVVVSAPRLAPSAFDTPAEATVLLQSDIQDPGNKSYRDALATEPGVRLDDRQENSSLLGGIEIRGLTTNATSGGNALIILDGIPQHRLSFGGPYPGALPPSEALERLELVQGGAPSSLYGRGALAGVLEMFTRSGGPVWEQDASESYESTTDTNRLAVGAGGPISWLTSGTTVGMSIVRTDWGGWQPRTNGDRTNANGQIVIPFGERDSLRLISGYVSSEEGSVSPVVVNKDGSLYPGESRDTNLAVPGQSSLGLREIREALIYTHDFSDSFHFKETFGYWNGQTASAVGRPSNAPAAGSTVVSRMASDQYYWEWDTYEDLRLEKSFRVSPDFRWLAIFGATGERSSWLNDNQTVTAQGATAAQGVPLNLSTFAEPDPRNFTVGPLTQRMTMENDFGIYEHNRVELWRWLVLEGGLRPDYFRRTQHNRTDGAAGELDGWDVSPDGAVLVKLLNAEGEKANAYFNYAHGFNPVYRAVSTTEIVNVNPETSNSYEAGVKGSFFDARLETNLVAYSLTRDNVVDTPPGATLPTNVGDWRIRGFEMGVTGRPAPGLELSAGGTVRQPLLQTVDGEPQFSGNQIPMVAHWEWSAAAGYKLPWGLEARATCRFVGPSYLDLGNTYHAPGYTLLNASISYVVKNASFSVYAANLLDQAYLADVFNDSTGTAFEGTPRTVGVTLTLRQ